MAILHRHRTPGLWLPKRQPTENVEIDWLHPLARGMVMCLLAQPNGAMVDLAKGSRGITTPPTIQINPSGVSYKDWTISNASTTDLDFTSGAWAAGTFCHLSALSPTNGQNVQLLGRTAYTSEVANSGWSITQSGSPGIIPQYAAYSFRNTDFNTYLLQGTSTATIGDQFIGTTSDGTTRRLIVNGVSEVQTTNNANPVTSGGALTVVNVGTGVIDGTYLALAWDRDVSLGEWAWLAAEPYAFLRSRNPQRFGTLASPTSVAWPSPTVSF